MTNQTDTDLGRRIRNLESKVSQLYSLLNHAEPDLAGGGGGGESTGGISEAVAAHVSSGNTLLAIKQYREETGCSLAEAKDAVDAMG